MIRERARDAGRIFSPFVAPDASSRAAARAVAAAPTTTVSDPHVATNHTLIFAMEVKQSRNTVPRLPKRRQTA